MQTILDDIEEQYPAVLKKRAVPVSRHADYRKWLMAGLFTFNFLFSLQLTSDSHQSLS